MWNYILSREHHEEIPQVGAVIMPNGIVRIFRMRDASDRSKFTDGVICKDFESLFEIIIALQKVAMKVRKNEK